MSMTETELASGRVVAIAGPVIDVEFPRGALPELNTALEFDIIVEDDIETLQLSAGNVLIVPKGCWHRFRSADGVTLMTATPKGEEPHLFVDDPREG